MIEMLLLILLAYLLGMYVNGINYKKIVLQKEEENAKLLSQKKSSEVRTGQIAEQLAPFLKEFKYNPKKTHFIGMPIDFIVFEDDKVVFLEIKSGKAQLSTTQRAIKKLVKDGKVVWDEMRIDGQAGNAADEGGSAGPDEAVPSQNNPRTEEGAV